MSVRCFFVLLCIFGALASIAWAQAVIEGRVELPKTHSAPVMNKRYEIVTKGGVLATSPPLAVVYLEGSFPKPSGLPTKEIAQKWVTALRSGMFIQGTRCLVNVFNGIKMCCLAVLGVHVLDLKLANYVGRCDAFEGEELTSEALFGSYLSLKSVLTPEEQSIFVEMNDRKGYTYAQIADYIEETYINNYYEESN